MLDPKRGDVVPLVPSKPKLLLYRPRTDGAYLLTDCDALSARSIQWCLAHDDMASWDALDKRCWAYGRTATEGNCVMVERLLINPGTPH